MNPDDLLKQPLTSVADDGFSERVMARLGAMERRRMLVAAAVIAAGVVSAFLLLPMQSIGAQLDIAIGQTASSTAVSLAAGAIVLTLFLEKQFSRL
ncbi:MAG: hypothetical protein KGJ49_05570 [Alphaproteobacteria bacterium]|nr:hypothetical protein [Alphaproteobacteria bacterium]